MYIVPVATLVLIYLPVYMTIYYYVIMSLAGMAGKM